MFNEYDVVVSRETINEKVPINTIGTIVMVLDKKEKVYEVEFFDKYYETLDVTEVSGDKLELSVPYKD